MLILAGVSINAIIGDNGVLTRTQYASFLNEMAAVEEAVQLWKAGETIEAKGAESKSIPANGLCKANELTNTERLVGEVGYYRIWSMSKAQPTTNILSDASSFNSAFESELVSYPAGVQDLYYLNNGALNIKENKTYLIDASTGMIYSMTGIGLKGVRCYSSNMAKAVMNGDSTTPLFAEAEVSAGGANGGQVLAGNNEPEFLPDGSKNPNYNPYGFKIIASPSSNNIYKLYNNGDLYGKGIKGTQLNTSIDEMNKINQAKFSKLTIPSDVSSYKKLISGSSTLYFIDKDDYLWALGSNSENKLGLTQEQQVEFTGRDVVKLNVDGKKVDMCWDLGGVLYVRTTDNCLYSMGGSYLELQDYVLGTGNTDPVTTFTKINFDNPNKIDYMVYCTIGWGGYRVIACCSDKTYYAVGESASELSGVSSVGTYKTFVPILNGYSYVYDDTQKKYIQKDYKAEADIDQNIKKLIPASISLSGWYLTILKDDGTLWCASGGELTQYDTATIGTDVKDVFRADSLPLCIKNDNTVWGMTSSRSDPIGMGSLGVGTPTQILLPSELVSSGIKEIYSLNGTIYYVSQAGKIYGSSTSTDYLCTTINEHKVIEIPGAPLVTSFYEGIDNNPYFSGGIVVAKGKDGNLYSIGNQSILFGNDILQQSWSKITDLKVKDIATGESNSLAVIDSNNNLYVCGNDARKLGLNISTPTKVANLTRVDDSLINGKVKSVNFTTGVMNVLTNDGNLYASGYYSANNSSQGWPYGTHPGWDEAVDHYNLVKIDISGVTMLNSRSKDQIAIANGKIYTWGANYYNTYNASSRIPILSSFNDIVDGTKVKQVFTSQEAVMLLMNDGSVYINGGNYGKEHAFSGIGLGNKALENKTSSFEGNKVSSFSSNIKVAMFLTENGQVYGYGMRNYLGVNDITSTIDDNIQKLPVGEEGEIMSQVVVGYGFAIVVSDKGKVYGTGSNLYGILGRWIGIDRNSPNSRYKTAFEWVECPELEI